MEYGAGGALRVVVVQDARFGLGADDGLGRANRPPALNAATQLPARRPAQGPTQTSGPPPVLETGVGDGVASGLIVGVGWISGTPGPVGAKVSPKSLIPQELDVE